MAKQQGRTKAAQARPPALADRVSEAGRTLGAVARRLAEAASQIPGAEEAQSRLRQVEQRVLRELKSRMDAAVRPGLGELARPPEDAPGLSRTYVIPLLQSPRKLLEELLERSLTQTREQAEEDFYSVLLSELVPDEARLLALLSDGAAQAVVHIGTGAPIGPVRTLAVENFSALGRPAQVKLLERMPIYLEHLKALGLLEEGPEDPALEPKYQIIEGLREVRDEVDRLRKQSRASSVRLVRRSLRLSALGRQLWEACTGDPAASRPGLRALR